MAIAKREVFALLLCCLRGEHKVASIYLLLMGFGLFEQTVISFEGVEIQLAARDTQAYREHFSKLKGSVDKYRRSKCSAEQKIGSIYCS